MVGIQHTYTNVDTMSNVKGFNKEFLCANSGFGTIRAHLLRSVSISREGFLKVFTG